MIDIRQMRYFVTLAETLHFGRAAERLHLSQPPLSRQIAALEKDLGVRLIERHSRQATLTHAGSRFLQDARAVIASFDEACRNAKAADRGELGELSIGFMMHAAYTVLPGLARGYIAAYPEIDLKLREVVPHALIGEVLAGRFDAGILFSPGAVRGLEIRPIYQERLCLAVYGSHRLAGRNSAGPEDIKDEPLIATSADSASMIRKAVEDYCRDAGFEPTIRLQAQLQNTIINLVAEGLGIALVPESMRRLALPSVSCISLADAPSVEHVLAWRPTNLNPALKNFLAMSLPARA
ncbi:MAG: LysR family transcriptional regulator [Proteobacteria bacterium]|nr:LysR family transcriptional regulator [Pseudomonadota bacterium]